MRSLGFIGNLIVLATVFGLCLGCTSAPKRGSSDWITLFDGSGLDAWEVLHGGEWTIENGVLVGRNGQNWSTDPEKSGSWLATRKTFDNFILEFEYAINERGNSGVFFRSAREKNPAFTGYEMQITDFFGHEPSKQGAGAVYDVAAPKYNLVKPAGEWNRVRITCDEALIRIEINGRNVLQMMGDRSRTGSIGLQNHDERSVVKFRNIRVREL